MVASVLIRRIEQIYDISDAERDAVAALPGEVRDVKEGDVLVREGEHVGWSTLLIDGFGCRYKDLRDGSRQISAVHVPGDFVDLHSYLLERLDHDISMLSAGRIAEVPHEAITRTIDRYPRLGRAFWKITLIDAAIHREQILSIGRRSAIARVAQLLRELEARLEGVDLSRDGEYKLPLTQSEIADVTGLTPVHVNRMVRQLREEGVAEVRGGIVRIRNRARLEAIAEYDPTYLYMKS